MNLFKKLFAQELPFEIEYYPVTGIYVVKYQSWWRGTQWLKEDYNTGIMRFTDLFDICEQYKSETEAREGLKIFREQQLKEGVIKIKI